MSDKLTFAVPSKGRLMEQTAEFLGQSGLTLRKVGHDRGYRGEIEGLKDIDVAFISASPARISCARTSPTHPSASIS
jgi:ATP phosphoribosyltransferase